MCVWCLLLNKTVEGKGVVVFAVGRRICGGEWVWCLLKRHVYGGEWILCLLWSHTDGKNSVSSVYCRVK